MDLHAEARQRAAEHRQRSVRINELAASIHSEADAATLIDEVIASLKEALPPSWVTEPVKMRLARAEFLAATHDSQLISEEHVAQVWNHYVREIGAVIVSAAEVHNLRDAQHAFSVRLWNQDGIQSIWSVPNIVAIRADGKVAHGCRAFEVIRLLYTMARFFENVRGARQRVRLGRMVSDELASRPEKRESRAVLTMAHDENPIRHAHAKYIQDHGAGAFDRLLGFLFEELFPPEQ